MSVEHPSEDALLEHLKTPDDRVARHIAECEQCRFRVPDLKAWLEALADPLVWEAVAQPRIQNVQAFDRTAAEEAAGRAILLQLPADVASWSRLLRRHQGTETVGFIRLLIANARSRHNRAPADSLIVLGIARDLVRRVADPLYLTADIDKERANALRLLGRYDAALEALNAAEGEYRRFPLADYHCAIVDWGRASVYFGLKELRLARTFAELAAEVFREYSDTVSLAQLMLLRGGILFEEGDLLHARDAFAEALPVFEELGDEETAARAQANIATCAVRLGDPGEAIRLARSAADAYDRLGMRAETVRLYWSMGEALRELGNPEAALQCLRRAAADFGLLDMLADVAAVGLDTAELLYERGDIEAASALASRLLRYFRENGENVQAASALLILTEAITGQMATEVSFREARSTIQAAVATSAADPIN